jgi:cytosine/adenosine deaminase-related metal-dependent hydrolase
MDLGESKGGLPPDFLVEELDAILASTESVVGRLHDGERVVVTVAPCSPFSVTPELMRESAALARRLGLRLHTHLAETLDEERDTLARFGGRPVDLVEELGWVAGDVWLAHGIHFNDDEVRRLGAAGTGVAHCPSSNARLGAGIARTRDLIDAGVPVGLGVDGAASNEAGSLLEELRHAALFARARGGPAALSVREALRLATMGGARVLGRADAIGSVEVGKLADLALWRVDTLPHAGIADPVAALALASAPPLELLLVNGAPVVEHDRLVRADEDELARDAVAASQRLLERSSR